MGLLGQVRQPHRLHSSLLRPGHFEGHLALSAPWNSSTSSIALTSSSEPFHEDHGPPVLRPLGLACPGLVRKAGRIYVYRTGQFRKDEWAQNLIRDQGIFDGLVGILCNPRKRVPPLSAPGPKRPQFVSRPRQQRVLYYYFLDPQFGLIHVRLQTWLPFTVQVYVNGHEWLAQQMVQKKVGFVQQHNAFTQLDDPVKAQRLADRFAHLNWPKTLDRWASRLIPCYATCSPVTPCIGSSISSRDATDLLFTSLCGVGRFIPLAPGLCGADVYPQGDPCFLGRKWDRRFDGEVHTHYESYSSAP